uniref:Cell surface protein n=1 Tax=Uncultured archaeon GZfos26G2 TaxID=3386331 RepID=Q649P0_UNCAG|nr:cell surface protein [uncultured archaeon GZfos34H9]
MKNKICSNLLAFSICLALIASGVAVDATLGNDTLNSDTASSQSIIHVPDDFARIQWAVDNAIAGDTIIVRGGTYNENVKVNKRLTIRSNSGPAHTTVVAEKTNAHVFEVTANYVSIKGFTVKNAIGKNEAGLHIYAGLYIHADHCNITDNRAVGNAYGFFLSDSTKNTIRNNTASANYGDGIYLDYSDSNTLSNNTVVKSNHRGIRLWHSHGNAVYNNDVALNNQYGIRLDYSHDNLLVQNKARSNNRDGYSLDYSNNNILINNIANLNNEIGISVIHSNKNTLINNTASANNEVGISLEASCNSTLKNNRMDGNYYNFCITADNVYHLIQSIDATNLVDEKHVYYWVGQQNRVIPNDAGFVCIVNSLNITVRDLTLTRNSVGVLLAYSMLSRIENVSTSNNYDGIALAASCNNILINNTNTNNKRGISLGASNFNLLAMNINLNNPDGVVLISSNNNFLTMNNISNCESNGILVVNSLYNIICLNNFINNFDMVCTLSSVTTWNSISEITYVYNKTTYTNYMGNYWGDYIRDVEIERDTGGDGIGDSPHYISLDDRDIYPLMKPFEDYSYVT